MADRKKYKLTILDGLYEGIHTALVFRVARAKVCEAFVGVAAYKGNNRVWARRFDADERRPRVEEGVHLDERRGILYVTGRTMELISDVVHQHGRGRDCRIQLTVRRGTSEVPVVFDFSGELFGVHDEYEPPVIEIGGELVVPIPPPLPGDRL